MIVLIILLLNQFFYVHAIVGGHEMIPYRQVLQTNVAFYFMKNAKNE